MLFDLDFETKFGMLSPRRIFNSTKWKGIENFILARYRVSKLGCLKRTAYSESILEKWYQ